jgi:hypothetical protein
MTAKQYEEIRADQKAIDNSKRPKLCPKHRQPMQFVYGAGWDHDRLVCCVPGCEEEEELETSSLPEVRG